MSTLPAVPKTLAVLKDPALLATLIPAGQDVRILGSPIQSGKEGLAVITRNR